ncbi:phosphotransferase family protein [Deferrisoma camini]|uniref:phosphotransferase family protein n=1 Tax=Deferrisoma camini TaxID=1035120 RepID=UPI0038B242D1
MARALELWLSAEVGVKNAQVEEARRNPSSSTWRVAATDARGEPVRFFVKRHASKRMFEREVMGLTLLSEYSGATEPYAVPRLVACDERRRLVVLSWVEGVQVGNLLRNAVGRGADEKSFRRGLRAAWMVGRWLTHLERRTRADEPAKFPVEPILARISELCDEISGWRVPGMTRGVLSRLRDVAEMLGCRLTGHYSVSLTHRDFWPDHIFVHPKVRRIVVIDFGRCLMGPAGRDAMQFWMRLADLALGNPLVSRSRVFALQAAFRDANPDFQPGAPECQLFGLLYRLEQVCSMWSAINSRRRTGFRDHIRMIVLCSAARKDVKRARRVAVRM